MGEQWLGFYPTSQVARLARIPTSTLYEWKRRGIIAPSVRVISAGEVADEGYSYADLTVVRLLRELRDDHIDLTSAGVALQHLSQRLGPVDSGWADAHVYFVGNRIYAERPDEWGITDATGFGQRLEERLFGDYFEELRRLEEGASIIIPEVFRRSIEIDPEIMGGEPVLRNTRVPTAVLMELVREGAKVRDVVALYRPIPKEDIEAAIAYERYLDEAA